MNLLPLLIEAVKQRGGAAVWVWVGMMLATWLVFAYGTDRPLKGTELLGAAFVYGLLIIGVSAVISSVQKKRASNPKPGPKPKKKRK